MVSPSRYLRCRNSISSNQTPPSQTVLPWKRPGSPPYVEVSRPPPKQRSREDTRQWDHQPPQRLNSHTISEISLTPCGQWGGASVLETKAIMDKEKSTSMGRFWQSLDGRRDRSGGGHKAWRSFLSFGRPRRSEQVGKTPVLGDSAPVPHLGSCTCSSLTSEPINAIGAVRPCRQRWPVLSTKNGLNGLNPPVVDGATGPT